MTNNRSIAEIIREIASVQNQSITDAYALSLYVRYMRAGGLSKNTIKDRSGAIRRLGDFLDPYGANPRAVLDATSDQLVEWQASRDDLATNSVAVYISHFLSFYRWCVRPARFIPESPAEDLILPAVKRGLPRPIPEDDLRMALDMCTDERVRRFLVLGAYAGLRGIDMSLLDRNDVLLDYERPRLRVRGKGGYEDIIDVGLEVVRVLEPLTGRTGAMFVDDDGRRLESRAICRAVNEFFERIGLPYTCHQLRHRYGTRLYWLTRDIRYVQRQMRHRTVSSTEVYTLIPTDKGEESMRALDAELAERPRLTGRDRRAALAESMSLLDAELAERQPQPDEEPAPVEPDLELTAPPVRAPNVTRPRHVLPAFSG